ncbi:DUF1360 domain-containing protein [Streptomyces sp. NPDC093591]|uniref:DUF1360 domain-containing protein n=1 Tax=Streptomyces sp. NPDC093591 TaxID=3366044 RepID=UPI003826A4C7
METWLLLIMLSLATYRLTRLVVEDTFPPVLWLRDRLVGGWRPLTEAEWEHVRSKGVPWKTQAIDGVENRWVERKKWSPYWLAELLSCPWCASGWVALALTAGTWAVVGLPVPLLVWFAVWAAGALIAAQDWA